MDWVECSLVLKAKAGERKGMVKMSRLDRLRIGLRKSFVVGLPANCFAGSLGVQSNKASWLASCGVGFLSAEVLLVVAAVIRL